MPLTEPLFELEQLPSGRYLLQLKYRIDLKNILFQKPMQKTNELRILILQLSFWQDSLDLTYLYAFAISNWSLYIFSHIFIALLKQNIAQTDVGRSNKLLINLQPIWLLLLSSHVRREYVGIGWSAELCMVRKRLAN